MLSRSESRLTVPPVPGGPRRTDRRGTRLAGACERNHPRPSRQRSLIVDFGFSILDGLILDFRFWIGPFDFGFWVLWMCFDTPCAGRPRLTAVGVGCGWRASERPAGASMETRRGLGRTFVSSRGQSMSPVTIPLRRGPLGRFPARSSTYSLTDPPPYPPPQGGRHLIAQAKLQWDERCRH